MSKEKIERSEAILRKKRNTRKGLYIRNKILIFLNDNFKDKFTIMQISDQIGTSYSSVYFHLRNMLVENIVKKEKVGQNTYWRITGFGQQTIKKWLKKNNDF
ncbi:MAG: winged helix-turn-helix domain-containing protein [Candidatus Thorarchaeota archaeon]